MKTPKRPVRLKQLKPLKKLKKLKPLKKPVNAGEKMYQRAGVKLHHRGVPNAPSEGFLQRDKQDENLRPAPAPLLNPKSMLTDVGPVELWATRWRRPSAAANPQGFCWQ
jgi:hypothetical protein